MKRRVHPGLVVGLWLVAIAVGLGAVFYGLGPLLQEREQRRLHAEMAEKIDEYANGFGVEADGSAVAADAPRPSDPVAILEIGSIELQQVVVEGVESSQTRLGPGHVPGTAGLGQPGNSVVVARRSSFGRSFGELRQVELGDPIVVSTVQGQSVYEVTDISKVTLEPVLVADLYGPSDDDELTLVTSASRLPWNDSRATVVVATLESDPFPPTAQGGRDLGNVGTSSDHGILPALVLALAAYGSAMGIGVVLYRRLSLRSAYLLSAPIVVAATVMAGETLSRALPAWM